MPAIKPHSTGTTDVAWDGPKMKANLKADGSASYYRSAFAWQDPEGDEGTKAAYKFIHHMVSGAGEVGAANSRACSAAIAVLNGGRGGADIPDGDRKGVWSHVGKHLRDAGYDAEEVPPLKQWEYDPATVELEKEFSMEVESKVLECPFIFAKELSEAGRFEGHAAVFGNVDLQGDKIKRGAFAETLEETGGQWPILMGHNMGRVIGFSTFAEEDNKGLRVVGEFTLGSDEGRNAYATAKHAAQLGQKFGLSIGYGVRGQDGASIDQATGIRTLKNLTVHEFSMAAVPANPRARIAAVKSAGDWTVREFEEHLRDVGFPKEAARTIASQGFRALDRRDAGEGDDSAAREFMSAVAREHFLLR